MWRWREAREEEKIREEIISGTRDKNHIIEEKRTEKGKQRKDKIYQEEIIVIEKLEKLRVWDRASCSQENLVNMLTLAPSEARAPAALTGPRWCWKTSEIFFTRQYLDIMFTMSLYPRAGVNRKQFLIADSKTIYAFVAKGEKFPTCSSFTDKTCDVQCKVK